jgi:ABC-type transport system substrate-binding protein
LQLTRRGLFGTGGALLVGGYGLYPSLGLAADVPLEFDGSKFQLAAPEPNPKYGGVLRIGITNRPPHFDLHQSGTFNNLGAMAPMFDNLIRRDPRDSGQTIIPDLAHSWQISKDRKTYTFFLRKGVLFGDGAALTADDVKATFDRIVRPPEGISIPRSILFKSVNEINVRDKYTVEFKLSEARSPNFIMSAFASGWNVILRKQSLEENNYNLRKVMLAPGTGPFRTVRRVENEVWVLEKKKDYWNTGPLSRWNRILQSDPVLAGTGRGNPVPPRRLRAGPGSGHRAQGEGYAGHVHGEVQPERDPGHLGEHAA